MSAEEAAAAAAKRAEFESGVAADPGNEKLWGRFVMFELKDRGGGGIEAARAVFERTLVALPDPAIENSVYWSWSMAEGMFGDVDGQRRVLERWVRRLPRGGGGFGKQGWDDYLKFEVHNGGVERVRAVSEGLLAAFPMDPFAYVLYVRALAALSRHMEAFDVTERGVKELSGWCRGHDELIWRFMAVYMKKLKMKQSTSWDDSCLW
ncbi:hypothetical protein QYE76_034223 [Lolium multiflorum]|uniref:Uncharacterized protein n=1 Tax=Lolium multiflorum TaxID=4521 RepID=A0AAD8VMU8_LOLMU|nr:hypothetical protein QYE76_034223 [Lolium multiflorum]